MRVTCCTLCFLLFDFQVVWILMDGCLLCVCRWSLKLLDGVNSLRVN